MDKTCVTCIHLQPKESRWLGHGYGSGCAAVEDGIHKLGPKTVYQPNGEVERTERGLIKMEPCYYWQAKDGYEQIEMFGR